ncbi:MAG: radical SAM family heme chaperone HemW [Oscillospiraceae bacterium]|jgi:oxygen-independent coproporphyrinogen-3 oxidase|nr:radical SAM family heme chaperone HemW [Oscillospiraceae bacterium]
MGVGLYLHVPFCRSKCGYCDFASYAGQGALMPPVLEAMHREMALAEGLSVRTVYIGGGTPTLLGAQALTALLDAARTHFTISPDAEISLEANPGTVDAPLLNALRRAGFNRLSLGAQSENPALLEKLGRIHRWPEVVTAVRLAREAGFDNLNLDLMYGLPGQTPADFRNTLAAALALDPEHLSIYSLIIEEGTPFYEQYGDAPGLLPSEDDLAQMADDALWITEDAGLARYEISNYAKEGYACQHNMGYWLRRDYLGIGCAAHSLLSNFRWANARDLQGYLAGKRDEETQISEEEAHFERLMLGLRLVQGIPWGEQALYDQFAEKLKKLRARGLLEWNEARIWPTARGLDLQNRVLVELMD